MSTRPGLVVLVGVCLCLFGGARRAIAEPSEACRLLASRFAAAPATVEPAELVNLTNCVATELAARTGVEPGVAAPQQAVPPAPPPNVFPSPPVPSPSVPSPVIPGPDQSGQAPAQPAQPAGPAASPAPPAPQPPQAPASRPRRFFGQWPPPAPWVQNWPESSVWERP
ncbi:MAG: hypothetical protein ACE147_01260 [Candidatus Methylomirabilales bacterium]